MFGNCISSIQKGTVWYKMSFKAMRFRSRKSPETVLLGVARDSPSEATQYLLDLPPIAIRGKLSMLLSQKENDPDCQETGRVWGKQNSQSSVYSALLGKFPKRVLSLLQDCGA